MCPACRMMGNEVSSWFLETDGAIKCLDHFYVTGVPSHLWSCGGTDNYFSLVCDGRKVRHVCVDIVQAIAHVHRINIREDGADIKIKLHIDELQVQNNKIHSKELKTQCLMQRASAMDLKINSSLPKL